MVEESTTNSISSNQMELILESLKFKTTRHSTAKNYHMIWRGFNNFIFKLDKKPDTWERRATLYGAYLVDKGVQSSTIKSYFSAIKKILTLNGFDFSINEVILNILTKSCHLINDRIRTRRPIKARLLDILLFEMERYFEMQIYLCWLYKAIFCLAYYGLFRIGELTRSNHVIKAKDVNIGQNKNKILIILYTSKTHGLESRPLEVKITGTAMASQTHNYKPNRQQTNSNQFEQNKQNVKFFCPFEITRKYLMLRGSYSSDCEQLFVFRDKSPVYPHHVRHILKELLKAVGLNPLAYNTQSFRIGHSSELIKLGYSVEAVKRFGRWKSNAIYKYIRQ